MATISVRVPDDLAARFTRTALMAGGRSAMLRRLMASAVDPTFALAPAPRPRADARVSIRLTAREAARVEAEARPMGLRNAAWIAALVRRRLLDEPSFGPVETQMLIGVRAELRRIGVNVNQIARALNTAVLEGRVLDAEVSSIEAFRRELRHHIAALGEAFAGNLAYWDFEP